MKQINTIVFSNIQMGNERSLFSNSSYNDHNIFQKLLFKNNQIYKNDHELGGNVENSLAKLPLSMLSQLYEIIANEQSIEDIESQLIEKMNFTEEEAKLFVEELHLNSRNILNEIIHLMELRETEARSHLLNIHPYVFNGEVINVPTTNINEYRSALEREAYALLNQASVLLQNGTSDGMTNISSKILDILEQLMIFDKEPLQNINRHNFQPYNHDNESNQLLDELINNFQNRMGMFSKQYYQTESKVTSQDVEKWIRNALTRQFETLPNNQIIGMNSTSIPVSNIEHYMIHVNQSNSITHPESNLIEQFQQVIRNSQFLSNNGVNQLIITLQPENLGDMAIRLLETDGEMTLKIIVSSKATKQMLESNIRELRNMFSPYQITIEEQKGDLQQIQQQLDDEFLEEQNENKQEHREKEQDQNRNFEEEFQNFLLNERV